MTRPKIIHLMTSLVAGGAETNLLALLDHLDRQAFKHMVAYGGEGGALEKEFADRGVALLRLSPNPLNIKVLFKKGDLLAKIKAARPDILHSHLDLSNVLGLAAKKVLGCPLVIHLHGLGMVPHNRLPGRPFKHRLWNLVARRYRKADKLIAICEFQLPFLRELGVRDEQIALIPNGINIDQDTPAAVSPREGYRFLNVGRFFPQKDHQTLIEAFHSVVADLPDIRLTLVGDGPLRQAIESQVRKRGLEQRVEFLGVRRDIPELMAASDCFVLSSRWELHPITILEAMRAGLPVIATNIGGVGGTVVDDVTGLLVAPEDAGQLAGAMRVLASDAGRGRHMGKEGRRVLQERFDNASVARRIEAVYAGVLASLRSG